ncbi:nitric oxide reductase FlRd-NAD(+) reductase [Vibrio ishigakensis]|uniref:Nitric oxide reductase FlRd-NAD(+) reductase n=1 Tax=Vibrio ishigakensis TaxID=1481914 RepID=A0A0B8QD55_9VIBR|nr:nitric oxide reductase FlRd-NAD(+) reductase [Vibrio ishigakensis]
MSEPIVIIGSGFAAYQLIKTIRRSDVDTAITVITADDGHDYNKPDLSHVFSKNQSVEDVITAKAEEFAQSQNLTLLANHVVSKVDTSAKQLVANDKAIAYSKLVLATGASAFVPPIEGANKQELLTLNSLKEFEQNRTKLADANRVMVIGGGVIGVEVALDLATAGKKVTLVEPNTQLMRAQLPEYVAFKLVQSLQDRSVRVITGKGVASVSHQGAATSVGLSDGSWIEVDQILVSAGLRPNVQLAIDAGIEVNRGICVDSTMQTSASDVYALGDCAEFEGMVRAYLQPTVISAVSLAKTLTGTPTQVKLPHAMVKVKTPSYPIQIGGRTDADSVSRWNFDILPEGIIAKGFDEQDKMVGFVATQDLTTKAFAMLREL